MAYIPHTDDDIKKMLKDIGVSSVRELLIKAVSEKFLKDYKLNLPRPLSEYEVITLMKEIARLNAHDLVCFAGGGSYDHFIPSAVFHILQRSEFYTAYTPYQAEASQGTLQAMFEYQSVIIELTNMEVANASMYEAGSALAEAILMAFRIKKKHKVLLPKNLNPLYKSVVYTYLHNLEDSEIVEIDFDKESGKIDLEDLVKKIDEKTACVVVQQPNFFGILEDVFDIEKIVKDKDLIFISVFYPISLGILAPPGDYGVDIAVGEGQSIGLPLSFGGPYLGVFTSRRKYIRYMPGRIVGVAEDVEGKRGYVMVLQTREQHIRREKATSNICTNQQLCALATLVYLSLMGKEGIKEVAYQSLQKAHYLADRLKEEGFEIIFKGKFFNEFVLRFENKRAEEVVKKGLERNYFLGVPLSKFGYDENLLLVSVTEKRTREEIENYIKILKEV